LYQRCRGLIPLLCFIVVLEKTAAQSNSSLCLLPQELPEMEYLEVSAIDLSPDGKILAAATDGGIYLYLAETLELQTQLVPKDGLRFGGTALKWSPDGSLLAAYVSASVGIRIWDIRDGIILETLIAHDDNPLYPVSSIDWSHDGQYLASAGVDSPVRLWEIESKKLLWEYPSEHNLQTNLSNLVAWSPTENRLAVAESENIGLWSVDKDVQEIEPTPIGLEDIIGVVWFSNDRLVAIGNDGISVNEFNIDNWANRLSIISEVNILSLALLSDDSTFVGGTDIGDIVIGDLSGAKTGKTISGYKISTAMGYLNSIFDIMASPDGKTVFSINLGYAVYKWDIDAGCVLAVLILPKTESSSSS